MAAALLTGCTSSNNTASTKKEGGSAPVAPAADNRPVFQVDPATAGTLTGSIHYTGKKPVLAKIDMDEDPECAKRGGKARTDESVVTGAKGSLANVFVYVKGGLEGKRFAVPATPVTIDQNGCWFQPRVIGIQVGQTLQVTNSDPVTHNIHPVAQVNREWNQSQAGGDPPLARKFSRPEIMIPVKCNIHRWMRAFIGVVDHPYFAVSGADGSFTIANLPPGTYTIGVWQEKLGTQEQQVTIAPSGKAVADFQFKGE